MRLRLVVLAPLAAAALLTACQGPSDDDGRSDDVVDSSFYRRGFFSVNALWGNKGAVLVGDYLLSRGLLLALDNHQYELLQVLSRAVRDMSEGELLQIKKARKLDITEMFDTVYHDITPDLAHQRDQLLAEFHIEHLRNNLGMSLSGGERRRVEIARAIATNPTFILLDEPFAGVDPISVSDIKTIVSHLKNRGLGVLITDHNVRETLDICEKAYIVSEGTIIAEGAPQTILSNKKVRDVYLGENFRL